MFKPSFAFLFVAGVLAACGSVTPAGMMAAMRLDPLETAPQDISVAVGVPRGLMLQDGDAEFHLAFRPEDVSVTSPIDVKVPLVVQSNPVEAPRASDENAVYVFGMSPQESQRVAEAQARIKALKARDVPGEGTLGIGIVGGCFTDGVPDSLPVSTWLRSDPGAGFVALTRQVDLFETLPAPDQRRLKAGLQPC